MSASDRLWDDPDETFRNRLTLWRDLDNPPPEVLAVVEEWIPTRKLNPFRGARCEREDDDFWFAQILGTLRAGHIVVCSYWIDRGAHAVRCDLFSTLAWPV